MEFNFRFNLTIEAENLDEAKEIILGMIEVQEE